jgi:hypothetical protein
VAKVFLEDIVDRVANPLLGEIKVCFLEGDCVDGMMLKIQAQFMERGKAIGRREAIDIVRPEAEDAGFGLSEVVAGR